MKIEVRSPIKIDRGGVAVQRLVDEAKRLTEQDLKPRIRFAKRVKRRIGTQLREAAEILLKEENGDG